MARAAVVREAALPVATALVALALAATLPGGVRGDCPNACSGNGKCLAPLDYCQCERPYMGSDCSQRACPRGLSWADVLIGDLNHDNLLNGGGHDSSLTGAARPTGTPDSTAINPMERPYGAWESHPSQLYGTQKDAMELYVRKEEGHFYTECSNAGICDRSTGICQCFDTFEGAACNRTVCPNLCSGHGVCRNLEQVTPSDTSYTLWNRQTVRGCECDAPWEGADCSLRKCPSNDDPLSDVTATRGVSENIAQNHESQRIKIACANNAPFTTDSNIRLTYTDVQFGDSFQTGLLNVGSADDQSTAILEALRGLPNQVLASTPEYDRVQGVSRTVGQDARNNPVYYYYVTFHYSLGNVPLMTIDSSGMTCKAGVVLNSGYATGTWVENVYVEYLGTGNTLGPTVATTVTLEVRDITTNAEMYSYIVELPGSSVSIDTTNQIAFSSTAQYLDPAIADLVPMKFAFPEGNGGSSDFRGSIGSRYTIHFTAGAADCSIVTPVYETSTTFPITYGIERISGGVAENLYIEYSSPFDVVSSALVTTITNTDVSGDPHVYQWTDSAGNSLTTQNHHDGWSTLGGATSSMDIYKVKVAFGFGQAGAGRSSSGAVWRFNAQSSYISGYGSATNDEDIQIGDNPSVLLDSIEEVHIVINIVALNLAPDAVQAGGANTDVYSYTLNGVEMGMYRVMDSFQTLGNSAMGHPTDANTFRVQFGRLAKQSNDRTVNDVWRFALIKMPIQASWGYQETFRAHFFNSDTSSFDARLMTPTQNAKVTFVINILETSETTDTYRWKLSTDEVWMGSAASPYAFSLGTTSDVGANTGTWRPQGLDANKHSEVENFALSLSGADLLNGAAGRSCDPDSINSYYYLTIGDDGVSDFLECSNRGLCNRKTGVCECFSNFAGSDCHRSLRLSF